MKFEVLKFGGPKFDTSFGFLWERNRHVKLSLTSLYENMVKGNCDKFANLGCYCQKFSNNWWTITF